MIPQPPSCPRARSNARQAILDAALACFSKLGYEATSIREISKAAGRSSAMISYYFCNKEGLYREVIRRACERTSLQFTPPERSSNPLTKELGLTRLRLALIGATGHIATGMTRGASRREQLKAVYINEILDPAPGMEAFLADCFAPIADELRRCVFAIRPELDPSQIDYWSSVALGACLSQATLARFNALVWKHHDFARQRQLDIERLALFICTGLLECPASTCLPQS